MEQTIIEAYQKGLDTQEQTAGYVCFEFADTSLGLYSEDREVISWLTQFFAGYFTPSQKKDPAATIYHSSDPVLFETLYTQLDAARKPEDNEFTNVEIQLDEDHTLLFDGEVSKKGPPESICYMLSKSQRKILTVFTGPTRVRQVIALRAVRNLMTLLLYENGWLPIHATACLRNGAGVSLIGGKFAGKTSTLLNLLTRSGSKLIANDKLFLRDAGSHLEGCGFPSKAGLRVGTLLTTPKLQHWIETATDTFYPQVSPEQIREITATTSPEELKNRTERITLVPSELAESLGIDIQPIAPIHLFMAVNYAPELAEAQIEPMAEETFLADAAPLARKLAKRQKFLRKFFEYSDKELENRLVALLQKYYAQITPKVLRQNERTNDQTSTIIDTLIQGR